MADVCGLKSSFIMLVKQCHKPSPSLPSLHHKSVVCLSFPVMGAITNVINHPSFKTSAFITVMLAYLYQTSGEHPTPPWSSGWCLKSEKPYGYDMVLDGFIMLTNSFIWFYMVLFGFIWFYMVLYGFIWFYHVTSNIKPTVHQGKFLPTLPTSRELVPGHILPSSQDGSWSQKTSSQPTSRPSLGPRNFNLFKWPSKYWIVFFGWFSCQIQSQNAAVSWASWAVAAIKVIETWGEIVSHMFKVDVTSC